MTDATLATESPGFRVQLNLFGGFDLLDDDFPDEPEIEWKSDEERELFVLRAIGALLEDSFERMREMDETERFEIFAWIFLLGSKAVVPFDYACRIYGIDPDRIRDELRKRYPEEVARVEKTELEACLIS